MDKANAVYAYTQPIVLSFTADVKKKLLHFYHQQAVHITLSTEGQ